MEEHGGELVIASIFARKQQTVEPQQKRGADAGSKPPDVQIRSISSLQSALFLWSVKVAAVKDGTISLISI